jgi:hypothetical protein
MYWKSYFPEGVLSLKGVTRGFKKGLELMNQASTLGDDARYRFVPLLPPPALKDIDIHMSLG